MATALLIRKGVFIKTGYKGVLNPSTLKDKVRYIMFEDQHCNRTNNLSGYMMLRNRPTTAPQSYPWTKYCEKPRRCISAAIILVISATSIPADEEFSVTDHFQFIRENSPLPSVFYVVPTGKYEISKRSRILTFSSFHLRVTELIRKTFM